MKTIRLLYCLTLALSGAIAYSADLPGAANGPPVEAIHPDRSEKPLKDAAEAQSLMARGTNGNVLLVP
jgi:hypothetical protein